MTHRRTMVRWLGALAAAALVSVSAACSSSEQPQADGASEAPAGTAPPRAGQDEPSADASPQPMQVAVSREQAVATSGDAIPVRADLAPLQRRGDVVVLNLSLTHTGDDSQWQLGDDLDDGTVNGLEGGVTDQDPARYSVDGISLIDGQNSKRHLVARDSRGFCVCSTGLSGVFLKPGSTVVLSATFAAPPEDVDSLDVEIPVFGTFPAVPVES